MALPGVASDASLPVPGSSHRRPPPRVLPLSGARPLVSNPWGYTPASRQAQVSAVLGQSGSGLRMEEPGGPEARSRRSREEPGGFSATVCRATPRGEDAGIPAPKPPEPVRAALPCCRGPGSLQPLSPLGPVVTLSGPAQLYADSDPRRLQGDSSPGEMGRKTPGSTPRLRSFLAASQCQEERGPWGLGQPGQRPAPNTASLAQGRATRDLRPSLTAAAAVPSPRTINTLIQPWPCWKSAPSVGGRLRGRWAGLARTDLTGQSFLR